MATPQWKPILRKALACIDDLGKRGIRTKWSFGGGTAMMMTYRHRDSNDVDIFFPDPQVLGYLSPRLQDEIQALTGCTDYIEQSEALKLILDVGDIDFIAALPLTKEPFEDWKFGKRKMLRERPVEIVAKKVVYRADNFKVRDVFDLACLLHKEPGEVAKHETLFRKKQGAILAQLELMKPRFKRLALEQVAVRPRFEKVRDTGIDRVLEFYQS